MGTVMSGEFPEVRYADAEGVSIAYEVRGDGPIDLVHVPGTMGGLVAGMVDTVVGPFYDQLASFARLIRLDKRGTGMSDPLVAGGAPPFEQQVGDVLAVMNTVGSERAALYGVGNGAQVALLFAAMHPERVTVLILLNAVARYFTADDYPWGPPIETRELSLRELREHWGEPDDPWQFQTGTPNRAESDRARYARMQQVSASKSAAVDDYRVFWDSDVRDVLPLVQAPTLITFPEARPFARDGGSYLADHIADARVVIRPGANLFLNHAWAADLGATIEEFLTGARPALPTDRILATVLFTDIVASTQHAVELGDRQWRVLLDAHDHAVRTELEHARGREIKQTGDGFLATFDGPARAIRCAQAIVRRAESTGLAVRAGVHVGECEVRGDDLAGIAVHIGARICTLAGPGEVLVTSTVRDLVAGSGIEFAERGRHELKGVPGEWTILAVQP